jgi:hypothetical protein
MYILYRYICVYIQVALDASTSDMRELLRKALDIPIADRKKCPNVTKGTKFACMSKTQMFAAYNRRRLHMIGERKTVAWWNAFFVDQLHTGEISGREVEAFGFWYSEGPEHWNLPDVVENGFESAASVSQIRRVNVLIFQQQMQHIKNIPSGVHVVDAGRYMDYEKFRDHLKEGVYLPLLADYVRVHAMSQSNSKYVIPLFVCCVLNIYIYIYIL